MDSSSLPAILVTALASATIALAPVPPTAIMPPVPASAPTTNPDQDPYQNQLNHLAEILGTVTYLRNLCGNSAEPPWREAMEKLISRNNENETHRKEALTASFNRGYQMIGTLHTACTPAARMAESQYRAEGATVVDEMTTHFGN